MTQLELPNLDLMALVICRHYEALVRPHPTVNHSWTIEVRHRVSGRTVIFPRSSNGFWYLRRNLLQYIQSLDETVLEEHWAANSPFKPLRES